MPIRRSCKFGAKPTQKVTRVIALVLIENTWQEQREETENTMREFSSATSLSIRYRANHTDVCARNTRKLIIPAARRIRYSMLILR